MALPKTIQDLDIDRFMSGNVGRLITNHKPLAGSPTMIFSESIDRLLCSATRNFQARRKFEYAMKHATFFVPLVCDTPIVEGYVKAGSKISMFDRIVHNRPYPVVCSSLEAANIHYPNRHLSTECHGSKLTTLNGAGVFFQGSTGSVHYSREELMKLEYCTPGDDNEWSIGPGAVQVFMLDPAPVHILDPIREVFEKTPEVEKAYCAGWCKQGITSFAIGVRGGCAETIIPQLTTVVRGAQRSGDVVDLIIFGPDNTFKETAFDPKFIFYDRQKARRVLC